jgi:hypothetical protein
MDYIENPTPEQRALIEARVPPQTKTMIQLIARGFAPVIRSFVVESFAKLMRPLNDRIQLIEKQQEKYERAMTANRHIAGTLMKRIESIEADQMKPLGVWTAGQYEKNNIVTDRGSSWICQRTTDQRPGNGDDSGWTLFVKRGRDGKDATKA